MSIRHRVTTTAIGTLAGAALAAFGPLAHAQISVPIDAKPTCVVLPVEFKSWFTTGMITVNGGVDPADSVTFPNIPNCDFYKWSEQMFLWLTSPAPAKYGAGAHVFDSPVFYDVSPEKNGQRTFIANGVGILKNFAPAILQTGPQKQAVVFDDAGRMFNVVRPAIGPAGMPQIRDTAGQMVDVVRLQAGPSGEPEFIDHENKAINVPMAANGAPQMLTAAGAAISITSQKILVNGQIKFLDSLGNAISTEQGQADGNVLMTQNNHLVYYGLHTNDVYAYFDTGIKNGGITPATLPFPTTAAALNTIKAFGLAHGKTFPDANALTIELKTSWAEATAVPNPNDYIGITATIPNYSPMTPTKWTLNGTKTAKLVLLGMHVVGPAFDHSEMLWATFEHVSNTPNDTYTYTLSNNTAKTVPKNTAGNWVFSPSNPVGQPNVPRMDVDGSDNIIALTNTTIGPSTILRINPWGTSPSSGAFTSNNTDIISIDHSVLSQLAVGDLRKNYIMTGTTWTINGAPSTPSSNQVGTNRMANTTMETFAQTANCFACHNFSPANPTDVSHIFSDMKPLFP
jgi:hypothetical protein